MVFSINKQAVEIKTRFQDAPLTSPNEVCAALGMLYRLYGLPVPEKRETTKEMIEDLKSGTDGLPAPSEFAGKLSRLLREYYKDGPVSEELYELLKYSYEEQGKGGRE